MNQPLTRAELLERYIAGDNITALLRGAELRNSEDMIEVAYDLQAGSYVKALNDERMLLHKQSYTAELASVIRQLGEAKTIMEAGVGEATTLSFVLQQIPDITAFGFDLSWSRISVARDWLRAQGVDQRASLFTGSIFQIPLPDSSIDVVYTSHSIEPNGGNEARAVQELFRVASKWLVLLEPAFDLATVEARNRMKQHGYCVDLLPAIQTLGLDVLRHELFAHSINPLNPTGITIIRKPEGPKNVARLCCPATGSELTEVNGALFSSQHLAAYPVLAGIPCLRTENAILASLLRLSGMNQS